jgi:predicted transcriptional regulator
VLIVWWPTCDALFTGCLQANEALRSELDRLRREPSPLIAANEKLAETQEDKDKFVKLLDNLNAHKASLQRKLAERQADVAAQQVRCQPLFY